MKKILSILYMLFAVLMLTQAQGKKNPPLNKGDFRAKQEAYMAEKAGLTQEEAKEFYSMPIGRTAAAAIGYKEMKPYLDGELTLEEAVEKLKAATRHYAKRQLTWFRRDEYIRWIDADMTDDIIAEALRILENN